MDSGQDIEDIFKPRTPTEKNESPNSVALDVILVILGFAISLIFNLLVDRKYLPDSYIYINGLILVNLVLFFLVTRIRKRRTDLLSRFFYAGVSIQMGWACAILLFDLLF